MVVAVELIDPVLAALVEVYRTRVRDGEDAGASSTVPIVRSLSPSSSRYSTEEPLRRPTRRAGESPPDQYMRPPRGVS